LFDARIVALLHLSIYYFCAIAINIMYKVLFIFLLFFFKLMPASAQTDWKLNTENDGIKIYTSLVPGSKIKALKVECEFKATASQFVTLLLDVKNAPEWVYHTKSCALVKQVSPAELYYYSEVSLPWPAEDRDFIAHLTVNQNPDTKVVTVDGPVVNDLVPVKAKTVRINHSNGKWVISPAGNGNIKVEYSLHVDPGGDLPVWLVNMFATEGPMQIFKNLKRELLKPAYKNASLAFITD
jgi:hypothetical protein